MKRLVCIVALLCGFLGVVYLGVMSLHCGIYCKDFGDRLYYAAFGGEDTSMFARQYDETKLSSVRFGMSEKEVRDILGQPLRIDAYKGYLGNVTFDTIWWYSKGRTGSNYWRRQVLLRSGRVVAIDAKYFVD
jgi:outer membrane protein assembly factor BamE (lipoprotein component of BamABCDE complex)